MQDALQNVCSVRAPAYGDRCMTRTRLATRLLSGLDLAIDLVTLGEYGLEPLPAGHHEGRERSGNGHGDGRGREEVDLRVDWEVLAPARRGESGLDARLPRRRAAA